MKAKILFLLLAATLLPTPAPAAPAHADALQALERHLKTILPKIIAAKKAATCAGLELSGQDFKTFATLHQQLLQKLDFLTLVDKQNPLPHDYVPSDLLPIIGGRFHLRAEAAKHLKAMTSAAEAENRALLVRSAYRSYGYQAGAYRRNPNPQSVAMAGHSQHQLGTAVDFVSQWPWLAANAGEYGFSLSYPEGATAKTGYIYEPWHYRYITVEGVQMQNKFFSGSQQDFLEFAHKCLAAAQ